MAKYSTMVYQISAIVYVDRQMTDRCQNYITQRGKDGIIPGTRFPLRCLSTCLTLMGIWFIYTRRRYITMADMKHGLATISYK